MFGATLIGRIIFSVLSLYMMLILARWVAGRLELEVEFGRLRWIAKAVDPLIDPLRRILPSMGPLDFGPIAALLVVWLVRIVLTQR